MTDEKKSPYLRVKRQVIRLGQDMFFTNALLRMNVTCKPRPVTTRVIGGVTMAGGMVTTNGKHLNFHPEYVDQIDDERIAYHMKKAVLQVALKHNLVRDRFPKVDKGILNLASTLSINYILFNEEGMPEEAPQAGQANTMFEYLAEGKPMEHYILALEDAFPPPDQQGGESQESGDEEGESQDSNGQGGGKGKSDKEKGDDDSDSEDNGDEDSESGDPDSSKGRSGDSDKDDEEENDNDSEQNESSEDKEDGTDAGDEQGSKDGDSEDQEGDESGSEDGKDGEPDESDEQEEDIDWDDLAESLVAGDVEENPDALNNPEIRESLEQEANQNMISAMASAKAEGRDHLINALKEQIDHNFEPSKLNYHQMLRRFCTTTVRSGYSYQRPNRRHSWRRDVILPSRTQKGLGNIVFAVDTSGSMNGADINRALDELDGIIRAFPNSKLTMIECDEEIRTITQVGRYNISELKKDKYWSGRGGTDLRPPFRKAAELPNVRCIIYLTDMMGQQPDPADVKIPTLWLRVGWATINKRYGGTAYESRVSRYSPKFGEVVDLEDIDK